MAASPCLETDLYDRRSGPSNLIRCSEYVSTSSSEDRYLMFLPERIARREPRRSAEIQKTTLLSEQGRVLCVILEQVSSI